MLPIPEQRTRFFPLFSVRLPQVFEFANHRDLNSSGNRRLCPCRRTARNRLGAPVQRKWTVRCFDVVGAAIERSTASNGADLFVVDAFAYARWRSDATSNLYAVACFEKDTGVAADDDTVLFASTKPAGTSTYAGSNRPSIGLLARSETPQENRSAVSIFCCSDIVDARPVKRLRTVSHDVNVFWGRMLSRLVKTQYASALCASCFALLLAAGCLRNILIGYKPHAVVQRCFWEDKRL